MLMDEQLTDEVCSLLDNLFSAPNEQNRYRLTLLKKLPQSTKPTKIKEGITSIFIGWNNRFRLWYWHTQNGTDFFTYY